MNKKKVSAHGAALTRFSWWQPVSIIYVSFDAGLFPVHVSWLWSNKKTYYIMWWEGGSDGPRGEGVRRWGWTKGKRLSAGWHSRWVYPSTSWIVAVKQVRPPGDLTWWPEFNGTRGFVLICIGWQYIFMQLRWLQHCWYWWREIEKGKTRLFVTVYTRRLPVVEANLRAANKWIVSYIRTV